MIDEHACGLHGPEEPCAYDGCALVCAVLLALAALAGWLCGKAGW